MSKSNSPSEHEHQGSSSAVEVERGVTQRLNELLGDSSVNAFALKCEIPESSMRKYLAGSIPGLLVSAQIAKANRVNLEWLASGKLPKLELSKDQEKLAELFDSYSINKGLAGAKARMFFCRDYNNGEITQDRTLTKAVPVVEPDELAQWHGAWVSSCRGTKEPHGHYKAGLDEALLTSIIDVLEEAIARRKGTLPPAKKAGLIAMLYDEYNRSETQKADPDKVVRLLRLVS